MLRKFVQHCSFTGSCPMVRSFASTFPLQSSVDDLGSISDSEEEDELTSSISSTQSVFNAKKEEVVTEIQYLKYVFPYLVPWSELKSTKLDKLAELSQEKRAKFILNVAASERFKQLGKAQRKRELEEFGVKGFNPNTIFIWTRKAAINTFLQNNVAHSMLFNTPTILDCSYQQNADRNENWRFEFSIVKALKRHLEAAVPLNLHLTGVPKDSQVSKALNNVHLTQPLMVHEHSEHYLDLFDKRKLVYLSSHANKSVPRYFEYNKIYIIGGIVASEDQSSMIKSKQEGLASRRLPTHEAGLRLRGGSMFPIEVMIRITAEAARTGCWLTALRNVTEKFNKSPDEMFEEKLKARKSKDERKQDKWEEWSLLKRMQAPNQNSSFQSPPHYNKRVNKPSQVPERQKSFKNAKNEFWESTSRGDKSLLHKQKDPDWLNTAVCDILNKSRDKGSSSPSVDKSLHSRTVRNGKNSTK